MGTGVREWLARFQNGDNLSGFPGRGEISKPQNMLKKLGEGDESFA
jgi:hypothetical protein